VLLIGQPGEQHGFRAIARRPMQQSGIEVVVFCTNLIDVTMNRLLFLFALMLVSLSAVAQTKT
jgi:hypothetical protein